LYALNEPVNLFFVVQSLGESCGEISVLDNQKTNMHNLVKGPATFMGYSAGMVIKKGSSEKLP